jgi:transcriptional regulator with XRE-family HTH domain
MIDDEARPRPRNLEGQLADIDKRVGRNLRDIRLRRGVEPSQISDALGLTVDEYLSFELGAQRPRPELLVRLAKVLDVRISHFFG